jgi:membrane fusion protein, multidrug efflux system
MQGPVVTEQRLVKARSAWHVVRFAAIASLLLVGGFGLTGCGKTSASDSSAAAAPAVIEIGKENVVAVARDEISVGPLVSGELKAEREATVRAELGGSVLRVTAEEGQPVRRGALLAQIEDRALGDSVASAQSAVRSAEHALEVAERELKRSESLVKGGALAERDLDVARTTAESARAQLADARARLASARRALADATVYSPMSGVVSRRHVNAGDVVSAGSELYTIIDPSSMRLEAAVPSEQLAAIRVGAPVIFEVRGYPDQTFDGRIERISPAADPATRQVPIFVTIPNKAGRLVAGLFADGRVTRESRQGLVVPETAVNFNGPQPWVLRVKDGKAERVPVTVGLRDQQTERVEIASGVNEGDILLLGAAQGMTPGTPVKIRNGSTA